MTSSAPPSWSSFWADRNSENAREEWRGSWAISLLYRRPGIFVAWWAARLGARPVQITVIALTLALSMPLQAWALPIGVAAICVCLSGMLFQVLDCADGSLARSTNQTSQRGGDMDFLTDTAQWALLYVSIGILADRTLDGGLFWTCLALCAAWSRLMARVVRDRLEQPTSAAPATTALNIPSIVLGGISGLLPFFALSGAWLGWAVGFLLIYALLDIAEGLLPLWRD